MEASDDSVTLSENNAMKKREEEGEEDSQNSSDNINFEDLIKATNVDTHQQAKKDDLETTRSKIEKSTAPQETSKVLNFTKFATKPTATIKNTNTGQVVIIHGPTGTPLPIRIANANSGAVGKQTPVTIQVLKMPDGSLVQLKNNKSLNLTNLSQVIKASDIRTTVGSSSTSVPTQQKITVASNNGTPVLKTLTVSEAQKAGLLKTKINDISTKKIIPTTSATILSGSVAANAINSNVGIKQKILLSDNREVVIKSDNETGKKQIIVPQHLLKLSPNTAGPIQAIQIPGKQGLQYVRVLGTTSSSTSGTIKTATTLASIKQKDISPKKMIVSNITSPIIGGQRIIMNSKTRQNLSFTNVSKESSNSGIPTIINTKQNEKHVITTVPTLRKITDQGATTKIVTVVKKEDDTTKSSNLAQKFKISQVNQVAVKKINSNNNPILNNQNPQNSKTQYLVVPQELFRKMQSNEKTIPETTNTTNTNTTISEELSPRKLYSVLKPSPDINSEELQQFNRRRSPSPPDSLRRKHCNCTKSQCLKLYCDCFANGEFCQDCNCKECFNNLEYEDERQKAIKLCLERNPSAFKPKITKARNQSDLRLHNKGCNCKRSGCLKNYCECYEAKIACSSNCKCFGCRNIEDRSEMDSNEIAKIAHNFGRGVATKRSHDNDNSELTSSLNIPPQSTNKQPYNFITQDVVDATIQCMIAQADECKKSGSPQKNAEKMILEELGRCLVEIIDFSIRNMDN